MPKPDKKGSGLGGFLLGDKGEASEDADMPEDETGSEEAELAAAQACIDAFESKDANALRNALRDFYEIIR